MNLLFGVTLNSSALINRRVSSKNSEQNDELTTVLEYDGFEDSVGLKIRIKIQNFCFSFLL